VQAAYRRAFTNLSEFRGEASICTWLARIVLYEALGRLRRRDAVAHTSMQDQQADKSPSFADGQPDSERIVAQRDIQRLLESAIDHLPQKYRTVLVTRTIEGMSVEETAMLLSIRPETVKTRLHRALALLTARLEVSIDAFPFGGERCRRLTARALKRLPQRVRRAAWSSLSGRPYPGSRTSVPEANVR
jgi:RNA polymerase sigma-70 factor (ECF subfamily)